jgi:hypothetical protein
MIMRSDYMNNPTLHHAYYLEIAQAAGLTARSLPADVATIREKLKTDEHLNNIPLGRWDSQALNNMSAIGRASKERGDVNSHTLCNGVCALKALAKHLAQQQETTT